MALSIVLSVLNSFANFSLRKRAELIVVLLSSWADPEGGGEFGADPLEYH